mgnify:CR=1 FL=1
MVSPSIYNTWIRTIFSWTYLSNICNFFVAISMSKARVVKCQKLINTIDFLTQIFFNAIMFSIIYLVFYKKMWCYYNFAHLSKVYSCWLFIFVIILTVYNRARHQCILDILSTICTNLENAA